MKVYDKACCLLDGQSVRVDNTFAVCKTIYASSASNAEKEDPTHDERQPSSPPAVPSFKGTYSSSSSLSSQSSASASSSSTLSLAAHEGKHSSSSASSSSLPLVAETELLCAEAQVDVPKQRKKTVFSRLGASVVTVCGTKGLVLVCPKVVPSEAHEHTIPAVEEVLEHRLELGPAGCPVGMCACDACLLLHLCLAASSL